MEALNPTIPSKPQFFSSLSIFSPKYSLRTWKKKNLYRFNIPNSKIPLYPPFSASKLRISAHFGRPTNRRNSLRKKLIEEQQQQVRHRSQNPVLDYDNSEIYYSNLGNDSVEKSKFSSNYGVSEGSVDSDSIEELKSKGLGESVLWNKLESWVDQYKNDSEFWGIGFNPIFTVFQDSGGNVERVVVNEDEILRRSGIEMEMYKKSEIEDLTEVNSKISHAKFLAREMENGNCVFSKSSSVAKFIVSGKHRGFDNAIWGLALRPGLSLKLPRIGIMVLCGLFVFWAMKAIFSGGKEKVEYTRLEKEIMRRKMKARKEKDKLVTGSVEVIQDPMEPQIERPRLNEQDLMNSITKVKASSNNTLALHESSSDRAVSKDLDSKIQEIRAMARQAREIERRDPSPSDTDGGDDLTVNELTDEKEVVKQHGVVVILPNDLSIEYSGQIRGVNGTSTPMSFNDVENNDTEFSEEVLVENIDTQTSSTSSMKVSNDGESTTREGVVSLPNGLSNEDSDQVEGDDGTLTPKFNDLKNNDARFGEEVLLENSGTQTASTSIMKVSNDGESTIQDVINRESAVNISDTTNVSQSSNTFESHSRKLKRSFGTKPRVIRSVKEAREFLSQKRNKQEPNQEYQEKTVPEGAAILSIEREKDTNSNGRKGIDKDNEVSGTTILDGTPDFAPAINAGKDSALKRKESVPAEKSGPQAADEGCKEIGPSVLALSRERETDSNTSLGLDKDNKIFQSTILRGPSNSASAASAFGDSTRKIMDGDPEDVEGGYRVDDLQKPPTSSVNESNSRSSEKISSVNKESWMEKNFHQLEPVVKKIEGGFRDNYMVAREKVKQELDTNFEMIQSKFDEDDAELDWMKDDRLREIVFQVRENELAGRDPFYLMDDEDKLGFFKGLERKVEKENEKLSSLHEYLHSNIENLDYGADGISMYDPPEKIIPRWKGPPLDRKPEFPNNFAEQRATLSARNFSNSDIERKDGQNFPQKSKEPPANENVQLTSAVNNQNTKILEGNSRSPKTVIEGSDGSVRAGKKSGKEYWQHTKKWSRGFLESYNAEADPETKAIMKDIGKDLDRWITEKEIEEAADLMDKISERGRKFIDKKLNKVKREMELFGPQAVMSKYREYAEEMAIEKKRNGSIRSIFVHADGFDMLLMAFGILGALGDGFSMPVVLFITSKIMNNIGGTVSDFFTQNISKNAVVLCYVACGQWVACFLEGYCWTRTAERQASRMRTRYLKAVLRQDVGYFDLHVTSTAEVITSVSNDSLVIQDAISEKVPVFLMNLATFIGSYVVAFAMLWRLAIVGFPFVVLLIIPGLIYGRSLMGIARKMREEYNKAGTIAEQAISSIRTVYSFVGENKTTAEYSSALQWTVKLGLRQGMAKGLAIGSNGIVFAIWSFMSYYGSRMVMYHGSQGGTVFAVGAAIAIGGLSLGSGLSNVKYFSDASAAGDRIMEVIRRVPKIDSDNMEGQTLQTVSGEVEFKHVEFAYPSRPESPIFRDFNLEIPAGKTVALVGGSGSGKSTVIALLQRFYDPVGGEILLDGVGIEKMQLKWLRSQMGLVSQEPALFATTITENILFGKEKADMDEVIEAAQASNAHNFISQLPQGYDTQVGERGVQMSGGQRQRIAIARAIIKAPRILLLDEATSALDSESERIVQEALDKAAVGRTTIIIAHRLSTIRNADIIAVIQNGQVMETGSHDQLIQDENGLYTSLIQLQQTEKSDSNNMTASTSSNTIAKFDTNNTSSRRLSMVSRSSSANSAAMSQRAETNDKIKEEQVFRVQSFRRLLAMNLPEWKQAIMGCSSAVLFGAVQPVYAFAMGSMISVYFLPDHSQIESRTRGYALCFLGLAVFSLVINITQHYNFAYMGEYLTKRIRERMFSKILTFEVGWFDRDENSSGAICSSLAKDANVVRSLVGDRMALVIQTFSAVTIACTMGLIIAWRLAVVMIAVQPLIIVCYYCKRVLLKSMSKKAIKAQNESSKLAAEAVSNLRTVTAFSSQARILQMLENAQEGPQRESIRQSWFAGIGLGTSQSLMSCTWALDFWYGGKLISQGYITAKALFETFMILVSTGRVIADAGTMTNDLAKGSDAVGSVFAVLDRYTGIEPDDPEGHQPNKITGHVELREVQFAYPARPDVMIFNGFSINIESGKSTALVGQSGSGKSTIIGLIERFYDPLGGVVKIDGRDIRTFHLRSLRKHIALVSQEPTLFAGTIRENITYGASDKTDETEIIEAAKAANAHDFIAGLKDGYDTWCGDRGLQLSGGQKQRVAIARAILKNPAILLLDEATSALDSQSEKVVQDALERVMVGRTSVVVAHRLSTIQNCDTIAVLDKGTVVERGTHSSLLGKGPNGAYYSLVSLQRRPHTV